MKISDIITEDRVIARLTAKNKKQVLEEMSQLLALNKDNIDAEELLKVLLEREKLGSTGVGNGVAIGQSTPDTRKNVVVAGPSFTTLRRQ